MKLLPFLLLGVILTLIIACKPSETTSTPTPPETPQPPTTTETTSKTDLTKLIGHTWKLVGMTFYEKDQYIMRPEKEQGLTIVFRDDAVMNYVLTVNKCMGKYWTDGEALKADNLGACTKMCCDSEFAKEFQDVLAGAKSFKINGEKYLDINCEEKILKLEKVSE